MPAVIPQSQLHLIMQHARTTYPEECCGFLLGTDSEVRMIHRAMPARNVNEDSRRNRYNIDPKDLIHAEEEADKSNLRLMGIYHSHPDAPPQPSQFDLEHAWPWYSYLVVSISKGEPTAVTAWLLSEDRSAFRPDELAITGAE